MQGSLCFNQYSVTRRTYPMISYRRQNCKCEDKFAWGKEYCSDANVCTDRYSPRWWSRSNENRVLWAQRMYQKCLTDMTWMMSTVLMPALRPVWHWLWYQFGMALALPQLKSFQIELELTTTMLGAIKNIYHNLQSVWIDLPVSDLHLTSKNRFSIIHSCGSTNAFAGHGCWRTGDTEAVVALNM